MTTKCLWFFSLHVFLFFVVVFSFSKSGRKPLYRELEGKRCIILHRIKTTLELLAKFHGYKQRSLTNFFFFELLYITENNAFNQYIGKNLTSSIYNGAYFLSFYFQAQCSDPGSPDHGRRRGNIFRHNSWVQFFCNVHYTLHGEEWIQCIDGSWGALLPKCLGKPATLDGMLFIGLCISVMIYWNPFGVF